MSQENDLARYKAELISERIVVLKDDWTTVFP